MARIQQIKHPDGDVIYPISHTNAIIDDNGNRLKDVLYTLENKQNKLDTLVVNNLTTGGADKALSAEMGKMLGVSVEELEEMGKDLKNRLLIIKGNLYTGKYVDGYINSSHGMLSTSDTLPNAHVSEPIPIVGGMVYSLSGRPEASPGGIRCFDADGNYMKVLSAETGVELPNNYYLPTPSGDNYVSNGQFKTPYNAVSIQFGIGVYNSNPQDTPVVLELVGEQYDENFVPSIFNGYNTAIESLRKELVPDMVKNTEDISDLTLNQPEVEYSDEDFEAGGYFPSNRIGLTIGTPIALNYMNYIFINVRVGETYDIYVNGGSTGRAWALLDENNKVISFAEDTGWAVRTVLIDNPLSVRLLVQSQSQQDIYVKKRGEYGKITQLERTTSELNSRVENLESKQTEVSFKILCFGNSFTQDSMSYVPIIMSNIAPNVKLTIGMAVIGGCPLVQHLTNFTGQQLTLDGTTYSPTNYSYQKSENGGAWVASSANVDKMLADEEWDVITFQQNSGAAHKDYDVYYAPYIYPLLKALYVKVNKAVKVGWLSIHGTYASTDEALLNNWEKVVENTQKVMDTSAVSVVFPFGTAVQNLRTIPEINALGDTGHLLADGGHLQDGIGCLTAAYCNTLKILQLLGLEKIGIIGEQTRITQQFITENNIQGTNMGDSGSIIGMTEDYVYLAQIAATKAVEKPYELTNIGANAI